MMRKILKPVLFVTGIVLLGLFVVIVINTVRYTPEKTAGVQTTEAEADTAKAAQLLSRAVQYQTDSTNQDHPAFVEFLAFLEQEFPAVHRTMERVVLASNTPLFKWQGSDESLQPVLLAAHYDVVPAAEDSLDQWTYPPFSGHQADGYIWGRGTLDNKGALVAMMIAAEQLITSGLTPNRTVYFSFGADEEVTGNGAKAVTRFFKDNNVRLAWTLDEGSFVLDGIVPGLDQPVASINLSEKGTLTLKLIAKAAGGHSSMPPRMTAVGRIARAVNRLQQVPIAGGLDGISADFFDQLGRYFSLEKRVLFANRWLFNPLLESILSASPSSDAMLRSTTAPTMLSGSTRSNVLATEATATVNFRIHPRDSIESIIAHVNKTIDDPGIEVEPDSENAIQASPVASTDNAGYGDIKASIQSAFGPLVSVPGLTIAATDSRFYAQAADAAYRINPFKITNDDLQRFHGINERLSIDNLAKGISFYTFLMQLQ